MTGLTLLDDPRPGGAEISAEMDEAMLALRSGAWLTVAGVVMLIGSTVLNQLGTASERLEMPAAGWILLFGVLAVQVTAVATAELGGEWIRRTFSPGAIYRYLWSTSVFEGLALAAGILLVPAGVVPISLMMLMMVVYAGYFYRRWEAISFIVVAAAANAAAVIIATPPEVPVSQFSAASIMPFAGVTLMAGAFVAVVRRGRDRVERRARVVATVGLARALDLRDASTADHSETVSAHAVGMARVLGLSPRQIERIALAGLLHDVGKIGIPDAVLLKPGKLTDAEWIMMRRHPEVGAQMLDSATLSDVRRWVLAHHERPDGTGYPFGLSGEDIPLEARILAVADAFEAMTANRPYRAGMPRADAVAELHRCSGTQFDPAVVAALEATLAGSARSPVAVAAA
ncbi:MAG: HD-GYP domain-containing protein [Solirubrobacteraceae bacterium]|nr:HD-GYP domain-containing protein [Solirubrobacteraceae bacterium]